MKLVCESAAVTNSYAEIGVGWIEENGLIKIKWDEVLPKVSVNCGIKANKCACSKTCSIDGPGCLRCTKSCLPCNQRCICKGGCANPHNNGGNCI